MNAWLDARRLKAAEGFRAHGVPHRRVEAWKYSDLRAHVDAEAVTDAGALKWTAQCEGVELVDLAHPHWPEWLERHIGRNGSGTLGEASLAFARAGFALRVAQSGKARISFAGPGQARVLIVLEAGASLEYIEIVEGEGFQNIGTDVSLGRNARFTHARLGRGGNAVRVQDVSAAVAASGVYRLHAVDLGGALSRFEFHGILAGEDANASLSGASVVSGTSHADVTTHIEHASGKTLSTQLFKLVAGGTARGVYQGKITVAEGAEGSDSRQTAKGLLLAERAEIDLKPELEILADDVKCTHGAAVGDLDADSLFYLRARGIPEAEARNLLIRAFLEDAFADVDDSAMREMLWSAVEAALPQAAAP